MEYLAVDFGTANCLAAEQGPDRKIRFVPLEDESYMLPTALYIPAQQEAMTEPSTLDYESHYKDFLRKQKLSYQTKLLDVENKYQGYILNKGPRKPAAPKRGDYLREEAFFAAQVSYKDACKLYERSLEHFKNGAAAEFRDELLRSIQSPTDDAAARALSDRELLRDIAARNFTQNFDETFFTVLKDANHKKPVFGQSALKRYSESRLGGFLLRSPKAFLGTLTHPEHIELFELGVSHLLRHIKTKAEEKWEKEFLGIVIGRPVNFLGVSDDSGDETALRILRNGARKAGFAEVRFVFEPHAAALAVSRVISETRDPAMVVDLGGGTTDCTYLKCEQENSLAILSSKGERIGGSDLDEQLAWSLFSAELGSGVRFTDGRPMPTSLIGDLLATRDVLKQARFRRSLDEIHTYLTKSNDDYRVFRLFETHRDQLQHRLILAAEEVKKSLSEEGSVRSRLAFFEKEIVVQYDRKRFREDVARQLIAIVNVARSCVQDAGGKDLPIRVFLTGGMSLSPDVLTGLQLALPRGSTFSKLDAFRSVGVGLSVVARALSDDPSLLSQGTTTVRGVEVMC
jgi:hypothetical chaperone protein